MAKYFDRPTQVMFFDADNDVYDAGIGYHDEIICACCGGVMSIDEVIENCPSNRKAICTFDDWVDFSTEISGGLV